MCLCVCVCVCLCVSVSVSVRVCVCVRVSAQEFDMGTFGQQLLVVNIISKELE